jgi:predicted Zn finger-like uncharacterized protein
MKIFRCPYCRTEYRLTLSPIAFRQRDQINCQTCSKVMYSWNGYEVPSFALVDVLK